MSPLMPRVLISDKLESPCLDLLRQAGIELDERHGLTGPALQEALRAADGVIVRSGTRITAELLDNPGQLRAVVRAGVGVDNIDVAAATRRGIVVMNTPGGNTVSTAEHTVTLVGAERPALLRAGAPVLNCARGGMINEETLGDALRSDDLPGAALDVFVQETPAADRPLLQLANVVVTPRVGVSAVEAETSV